ncbi:unnamed protein product, partial [Choristocarpus tenellus]
MNILSGNRISDHVGQLVIANATPYTWRRVAQEFVTTGLDGTQDSAVFERTTEWVFPVAVNAGQSVTARVAFCGMGATALATFQVDVGNGDSNPSLTFSLTHRALRVDLSQLSDLPGWVSVPPPPYPLANMSWRRDAIASFTLGTNAAFEDSASNKDAFPTTSGGSEEEVQHASTPCQFGKVRM